MIIFSSFLFVDAHIIGGMEQNDRGYRFQFLSDPLFPIEGEETYLLFSVQNATTQLGIDGTKVEVSLLYDDQIIAQFKNNPKIFEENDMPVEEIDFTDNKLKYFDPLNGDFSIKFEFVEPGDYSVLVEIIDSADTSTASFPIEISSSNSFDDILLVLSIMIGLVLLGIIVRMKYL